MKNTIYKPNLTRRKEMLAVIAKDEPSWKFRIILTVVLFLTSAFIILATILLIINNQANISGVLAFVLGAIAFACVPFFIALSTKNKAKYKCTYPYSSYANGTLILDDENLQYLFWQVGPTEPAAYSSSHAVYNDEDKFVYRISRDSISKLFVDEKGICTIIGDGKISIPDWAVIPKSEIKKISKEFSFVLAFNEKNVKESLIKWRNNNGSN